MTFSKWFVRCLGAMLLLAAGCAPGRATREPLGASQAALTGVTWTDVVGASASGNNLTKTAGAGWNAGAASNETLTADGNAQFTTAEATTDKVVGLAHADPAQNQFAIDFAFYLSSGGDVDVYEHGTYAGYFGSYAAGDTFRIQVAGSQVTYLKNGSLLYTSTKTPTFPLLVGAALFTTGTTVDNVTLTAATAYWQDAVGVSTSGPSLTKTGTTGWNAGAASLATLAGDGYATFTTAEANTDKMAGLSHTDPAQNQFAIDFGFYLSSGGDVDVYEDGTYAGYFGTYAAGDTFQIQVAGSKVAYLKNATLLHTSTKAPTSPLLFGAALFTTGATVNNVVISPFWQDAVGVTTTGPSMTKTGTAGWNAGAASTQTIAGDGYATFTTAEANTDKMVGLSHADPAQNQFAIDFGFYLTSDGSVDVYEDGVFAGYFGPYAAGDVLKIQVAGAQVTYLKNGTVLYTSGKAPSHPLLFATSLYSPGATVDNVVVYSAPVLWQDVVGVTTSGTSMTKLAATGFGNAGAASVATLSGDGYVSFTTNGNTTVAGLAHADPAQSFAAIDFGLYLSSFGGVGIYEDGAVIGAFGTYVAGDVFKIQVAGTQVAYLKNGKVLYASTKVPTLPLLFGATPYAQGAAVNAVTFVPGPIYWKDEIGVTTAGPSMTKTGAVGWNAGAVSVASLSDSGYAVFTTGETNTDKLAGLSHVDPAGSDTAIDFGVRLSSSGGVLIYEDGTNVGTFGTYAAGDEIGIQVVGTQVDYLKNGRLLYTSSNTPTFPLFFGTSLYSTGATIKNVSVVPTAAAVCGIQCPAGTVFSNFANFYQCTPIDDPNWGCGPWTSTSGACPSPAHAFSACVEGACGIQCAAGWADCNGLAADGCEADLTSTATCGACNGHCAAGQVCLAGTCAAACQPPLTNCGGSCVNLTTDPNHCGGCNSAPCPGAAPSCSGGTCGPFNCPAGRTYCGGNCIDLSDDPNNCGACGVTCPVTGAGPGACTGGTCGPCAAGFTNCGNVCVDLLHDGINCGVCTAYCSAGSHFWMYGACESGLCVSAPPTLVSGLNGVTQIALDATYVYWTETGAGNVTKVPIAGGTPIPIATGQFKPLHVAVDASNVYWTNNLGAAVMAAPVAGGSPSVFADAVSPTHVVLDTDTVYWDDSNGVVWSQKKAGGSPVVVFSNGNGISSLAVSATYVYASAGSAIYLIPKASGSPITVTCQGSPGNPCDPTVIAVAGTTVYATGVTTLLNGVLPTSADFVFDESSPTQQYPFANNVVAMAFDASWNYASLEIRVLNFVAFQPVVQRSRACGSPLVVATEPWLTFLAANTTSIATDNGAWLYWTDGANIGRVAK
jgi:hypothetical protein